LRLLCAVYAARRDRGAFRKGHVVCHLPGLQGARRLPDGEPAMIPSASGAAAATLGASSRTIPFDYVFRFDLEGREGKTHSQIVDVSVEGPFTAVSIGYGVVAVPDPAVRKFGPTTAAAVVLSSTSPPNLAAQSFGGLIEGLAEAFGEGSVAKSKVVGPQTAAALLNGIRLNARFAAAALANGGAGALVKGSLGELFEVVPLPAKD